MRHKALATEVVATRTVLLRAASAELRNLTWAEDAVSETMLAALEKPPEDAQPAQLRAWLFGILRHKIVDQLRRNGSKRMIVAASELGDHDTHEAAAGPLHSDPFHGLAAIEFVRALESALHELPERHAAALLMTDLLGKSAKEVCTELGLTPGNLWVILHRTRKQLRADLEHHAQD